MKKIHVLATIGTIALLSTAMAWPVAAASTEGYTLAQARAEQILINKANRGNRGNDASQTPRGEGQNYQDQDGDNICDNYPGGAGICDEDGDGICDITGEPVGNQGQGSRDGTGRGAGSGRGVMDADSDGICDVTGEAVGSQGQGSQDGTGRGAGSGRGMVDADGDGICDVTGEAIGSTAGQGSQRMGRGNRS